MKTTKTAKKTAPASPALSHSEEQAWTQLESICEMVAALDSKELGREEAEQRIHEDPLSVEVRSGWYALAGTESDKSPAEFAILLCTGGPAVRIIGEVDQYNEPANPRIEHQDWGTPWTALRGLTDAQSAALLTYCQQFYFGD